MKKLFCLLTMIAFLSAMALPATADQASSTDLLLEQLAAVMDVCEQIYEIRSDVLQHINAFCEKNDYQDLLNSRVACDDARRALQDIDVPAWSLSDETVSELLLAGVDTDALELETLNLDNTIKNEIDRMVMYKTLLYSSVYQCSQRVTLLDWQDISSEKTKLDAQYNGYLVNDLLLPLSGQSEVAVFWSEINQHWAKIGQYINDWESSAETISNATEALLGEYEKLNSKASAVKGQDSYFVEQYAAKISDVDIEALKKDTNAVSQMPTMAPLPSGWLIPETSSIYGYREEDDSAIDTILLYDSSVSLESFMEYIEQLMSFGANVYSTDVKDEAEVQYVFVIDNHALGLYWYSGQGAFVSYDPRYITLEAAAYIACCQ